MAVIETENDVATLGGLEGLFDNVISAALALGGIILFVMLIIGGFTYITAGDDPQNAEAAKKTLTTAIGGMVLIALAFLILRVIATFTGAGVTEFTIFQ